MLSDATAWVFSVSTVFFCLWHCLVKICNISIGALWHHPPLHHDHDKAPSRSGADAEDLLSDDMYAVMNCATSFPHSWALQWHRRPLGPFSERKEESEMNNGCSGWIKAILSACRSVNGQTGYVSHDLRCAKSHCSSALKVTVQHESQGALSCRHLHPHGDILLKGVSFSTNKDYFSLIALLSLLVNECLQKSKWNLKNHACLELRPLRPNVN